MKHYAESTERVFNELGSGLSAWKLLVGLEGIAPFGINIFVKTIDKRSIT